MGFFASTRSIRPISNSSQARHRERKVVEAPTDSSDGPLLMTRDGSMSLISPLSSASASLASNLRLTNQESHDLAYRLEELAAAYRSNTIDEESYRLLRHSAFIALASTTTVPTPRSIGHVPQLDVPMNDPSIDFRPLAAGLLAPASQISKRFSTVGSILSRFCRSSRYRSGQMVSRTAESDRESLDSSLPTSAVRHVSHPGYQATQPTLYVPHEYVHSTRPPSAFRFWTDVLEPHTPSLIPKLNSSSAWVSEDASPAVIRAEIHRMKVEALQLESSFREAELMIRSDLDLLTPDPPSTPTPHPPHGYLVHFGNADSPRVATQPSAQVSALFKHSNMREPPGTTVAVVDHGGYQQTPVVDETRIEDLVTAPTRTSFLKLKIIDLERRGVEASSRYGRKLAFLSARLEAAELRLKARC